MLLCLCKSIYLLSCLRSSRPVSSSSPDEGSWDGEDGPDEPGGVSDDETLQILPQSAGDIHVFRDDFNLNIIDSQSALIVSALLPVNHLVASLQPADAGHLPARGGSVQVNDHVVFCHQKLQAAHHISDNRADKLTPDSGWREEQGFLKAKWGFVKLSHLLFLSFKIKVRSFPLRKNKKRKAEQWKYSMNLTGRGSPWCTCSPHSCCQGDSRRQTR